jgi:hypothetical protein
MQERRKHPRRRALKGGRIVFNDRFSALDCTVRNLSPQGALLQVAGPQGIPDAFSLELGSGAVHACKVIWRRARQVGVVFAEAERAPPCEAAHKGGAGQGLHPGAHSDPRRFP